MSGLSFSEMNTWRVCVKTNLQQVAENSGANVRVINPCDYYQYDLKKHQSELEIMNYDLARVRESDLVIVNLDRLSTSIGTIIECYEAYKKEIPVLAFGEREDYENLHPWIQCCITRYEKNYRECINYISDFYIT